MKRLTMEHHKREAGRALMSPARSRLSSVFPKWRETAVPSTSRRLILELSPASVELLDSLAEPPLLGHEELCLLSV